MTLLQPDTNLLIPETQTLWTPEEQPLSMLDAALMFEDPPEIKALGGIMPMKDWPGRRMESADIIKSAQNGFGRDWFRFWHRYIVFEEVWGEGGVWDLAREGKTDDYYFDIFHWSQTLVFGDYGLGKSTFFSSKANHWAQRGIPIFHNGLYLGGWIFEGNDSFVMMANMPKCCVLGHDEASGTAGKNFHQTIALQVLLALGVNIRKLDCDWYLIGKKWKSLPPELLEDCQNAIELLETHVEVQNPPDGLEEWNNPANFQLRYQGWKDYPYRRMQERKKERRRSGEDYDEEEEGFGPPDFEVELDPHAARICYASTDSFRLADLPGFLSNRDDVRARLAGNRDDSLGNKRDPIIAGVLDYAAGLAEVLNQPGEEPIKWVTAGMIRQVTGLNVSQIGIAVNSMGVRSHRRHGYDAEELVRAWENETNL